MQLVLRKELKYVLWKLCTFFHKYLLALKKSNNAYQISRDFFKGCLNMMAMSCLNIEKWIKSILGGQLPTLDPICPCVLIS